MAQHHRVGALVTECYFVYSCFGAEGMRSQIKTNDSGSGRGAEYVWEPVPGSSDVAQEQRVESGHPKRALELISPSSFLIVQFNGEPVFSTLSGAFVVQWSEEEVYRRLKFRSTAGAVHSHCCVRAFAEAPDRSETRCSSLPAFLAELQVVLRELSITLVHPLIFANLPKRIQGP